MLAMEIGDECDVVGDEECPECHNVHEDEGGGGEHDGVRVVVVVGACQSEVKRDVVE